MSSFTPGTEPLPGSFPGQPSSPYPPMPPPRKKRSRRRLWLSIAVGLVVLFLVLGVIGNLTGAGKSSAPTSSPTQPVVQHQLTQVSQPTQASQPTSVPTAQPSPTQQPTPTPTQSTTEAPIPSAAEPSQLLSAKDGTVTDVSVPTTNSDGTKNVAVDVQVNNPTQTRVKHIAYELTQFFFQRTDVGLVNLAFHANGYTGMDDPIASCGGLISSGGVGLDENQLWTAWTGVFNADLPA